MDSKNGKSFVKLYMVNEAKYICTRIPKAVLVNTFYPYNNFYPKSLEYKLLFAHPIIICPSSNDNDTRFAQINVLYNHMSIQRTLFVNALCAQNNFYPKILIFFCGIQQQKYFIQYVIKNKLYFFCKSLFLIVIEHANFRVSISDYKRISIIHFKELCTYYFRCRFALRIGMSNDTAPKNTSPNLSSTFLTFF